MEEPAEASDSEASGLAEKDSPEVGPLGREYLDLLEESWRLDARLATTLAKLDSSGEWRLDGSATCQAWLRQHGRMTASAASSRVKTARRLRNLPRTAEAFAAGELSSDHVRVIAHGTDVAESLDGIDRLDVEEVARLVAEGEKVFIDAARSLDPTRLRRVVTHWRHAVEPQVVITDKTGRVCRRKLHMSQTLDGRFVIDGELDLEGGTVLQTALDALMQPGPTDTPRRTASRRRADALVELARQGLDGGRLPTAGGEKPHLSVLVYLETLEARTGAPAAEFDNGELLSGEATRRLACDAGISRIITDGTSQALDVGRRTPTIPPAIRRALVVRDRGCAWPGCDRPPGWCDAHHLHHWANGGDTRLDNLALLCRAHHTKLHEHRWTAELTDDGELEVKPP
ncbi:MAG: HNH endonuclease [Acidimicrobiia bacterium]|nr:HNH endonuclease [Acidimicrobiia bacterium]